MSIEALLEERDGGAVKVEAVLSRDGTVLTGHVYRFTSGLVAQELRFQHGPLRAAGHNGCQTEDVLRVLIHRLSHLDADRPCPENHHAIVKLEEALLWLERRTRDRKSRGVEGTTAP